MFDSNPVLTGTEKLSALDHLYDDFTRPFNNPRDYPDGWKQTEEPSRGGAIGGHIVEVDGERFKVVERIPKRLDLERWVPGRFPNMLKFQSVRLNCSTFGQYYEIASWSGVKDTLSGEVKWSSPAPLTDTAWCFRYGGRFKRSIL